MIKIDINQIKFEKRNVNAERCGKCGQETTENCSAYGADKCPACGESYNGARAKFKKEVSFIVLPPIEVESPEGKLSSTGKTFLHTYAGTGKKLEVSGRKAQIKVSFEAENKVSGKVKVVNL